MGAFGIAANRSTSCPGRSVFEGRGIRAILQAPQLAVAQVVTRTTKKKEDVLEDDPRLSERTEATQITSLLGPVSGPSGSTTAVAKPATKALFPFPRPTEIAESPGPANAPRMKLLFPRQER